MPRINEYPSIKAVALTMACSNDMINRLHTETQFLEDTDAVLASFDEADLRALDAWLATLSDADRDTLADGEYDEAQALSAQGPSNAEGNVAEAVLEALFDGGCRAMAVAKAARGVDRDALASVLRDRLASRLPRMRRATPPLYPYQRQAMEALAQGGRPMDSQASGAGFDWDVPTPTPAPAMPRTEGRARRRSRVDYSVKQRIVELKPYGKWPRYGTARAAKTEVVRTKLKAREEQGLTTRVRDLLGLYYEHESKRGSITFHDLEVMQDKFLINIKEGE